MLVFCCSFDVVLRTAFAFASLQLSLHDGLDNVCFCVPLVVSCFWLFDLVVWSSRFSFRLIMDLFFNVLLQ